MLYKNAKLRLSKVVEKYKKFIFLLKFDFKIILTDI